MSDKINTKPDPHEKVYTDEVDDTWYVFGEDSGFAYASYYSRWQADAHAEHLNITRRAYKGQHEKDNQNH